MANFRGFEQIEIVPREHVVLVGEPRAGRSDLLAALAKVFEMDPPRMNEFDFHNGDMSKDVEIEVIVGCLSQTLQQRFLDRLEFWDRPTSTLIEGGDDPGGLPADAHPVLRLAYRARWDLNEERSDQTVYWPKSSDPSTDDLRRIPRAFAITEDGALLRVNAQTNSVTLVNGTPDSHLLAGIGVEPAGE